jgi:hypothetical protein
MEIWRIIKDMEESAFSEIDKMKAELTQAKLTMVVNYGPEGKTIKGLVEQNQTMEQMIVSVCQYYHKFIPFESGGKNETKLCSR